MKTTLRARRLFTEDGTIDYPEILIEAGQITGIAAGSPCDSEETLAPPFLDIHVHGAMAHDFMTATARDIGEVGGFLASRGVGSYLPTTVTASIDSTLRALNVLAGAIESGGHAESDGATPLGIHLEGPFVSHVRRGVHPAECLLEPGIATFDRFQQAARGHIRLMTIAPELPGALDLIRHATAAGVRISLGHSDATEAESLDAIRAGARSATHTFNAMRALNQREPGILGAVLDQDELYAELISDGIHVHPALVRLWLKMKGQDRAILVTDGISATGMVDGEYVLGSLLVQLRSGVCTSGGVLAGSVLTMDHAVANLQRFTGCSLETAVRLASVNPARMLGGDVQTSVAAGSHANFNVFDEAGVLTGSIRSGRRVMK